MGAVDWHCAGDRGWEGRREGEEGEEGAQTPSSLNPGSENLTGRPLCDVRRGVPHEHEWGGGGGLATGSTL